MTGAFLGDFYAFCADRGAAGQLRRAAAGEEETVLLEYEVPMCIRLSASVTETMRLCLKENWEGKNVSRSAAFFMRLWMAYGEVSAEPGSGEWGEGFEKLQQDMSNAPLIAASIVSAIGWYFDTLDEVLEMTELVMEGLTEFVTDGMTELVMDGMMEKRGECTAAAQAVSAAVFWMREGREKEEIREDCRRILDSAGEELTGEGEEVFRMIRQVMDIVTEENGWEEIVKMAYVEGGRSAACIAGAIADGRYAEDRGLIAEARLHVGPELARVMDDLEDFQARLFGYTALGNALCDFLFSYPEEVAWEEISREGRKTILHKLAATASVYYVVTSRDSRAFQKGEEDEVPEVDMKFMEENGTLLNMCLVGPQEEASLAVFTQRPSKAGFSIEGAGTSMERAGIIRHPLRRGLAFFLGTPGIQGLVLNPGEHNYCIGREEAETIMKYAARLYPLSEKEAVWQMNLMKRG